VGCGTNKIMQILLVSSNRDFTQRLKEDLEKNNFRLDIYTEPSKALERFVNHSNDYTLVLSDTLTTGITGFGLAKKIRRIHNNILIILMTPFEINKEEVDIVLPSTRIDALITKPFRAETLVKMIKKQLARKTIAEIDHA
jgi:DNA-binding response OmpR family regulator